MESHQPTQQPLSRIIAQAKGPRPGERVPFVQATPSRLGKSSTVATARIPASSHSGDSVSLKNKLSRLCDYPSWNSGVSPYYSRLGEGHSLERDLQVSHLLAHAHLAQPNINTHKSFTYTQQQHSSITDTIQSRNNQNTKKKRKP
ncbi:hypothetical protein DEO72_LG3g291 [Vigna unguiculata]|uniref:Uncharacterized protein n=1 Tax=Vigna unguiculata TaxID=3917 RepID=A0A4D6LBD6_VIGUN|nr:hypothetical protein DEO72_LG3g291 [Vigna unguiculata]